MKHLILLFVLILPFLFGCLSLPPTDYYLLNDKGELGTTEFNRYRAPLEYLFFNKGWETTSYGEAEIFIALSLKVTHEPDGYRLSPQYDKETNTTNWIHKGAITPRLTVTITYLEGNSYRLGRREILKESHWSISAEDLEERKDEYYLEVLQKKQPVF